MLLKTKVSIKNDSKYYIFVHNRKTCLVEINFRDMGIRGTPAEINNFRFFRGY